MSGPQVHSHPPFWGSYSNLYGELTASEVLTLEEAILASRLGRFNEACRIWREKLPATHSAPVLAIEKALLESRLGRHASRLEILETALASRESWRNQYSEQETDLIKILIAAAKVEANGSLRPALVQARQIRTVLQRRPLEEWSRTELATATEYIKIMKLCKKYSNWLDPQVDPFFPESKDGSAWGGIHALQVILMRANVMYPCLSLLVAERDLLDKAEDQCHYFEFIEICESRLLESHEQNLLTTIYARLLLSENLLELEQYEQVFHQLQQVESTMERLQWIRHSDTLALWFRKLKVVSKAPSTVENLSTRLDLARTMQENEDVLQETEILLDILLILNQVDQMKRDSAWSDMNTANFNRFYELHSGSGGNALMFSQVLSRFANSENSIANAGEYLHRLRQFESRFPAFDIPFHHLFLYQSASEAARKLGSEEMERSFEVKMSLVGASCPVQPTLQSFLYRSKDLSEWPLHFFIMLFEWMKLDLEKGRLSASEVVCLLLLDKPNLTLTRDLAREMCNAHMGPESSSDIANRMYGETSPVDAEIWDIYFDRYEKWLWNSPREVEQSIRHTILLDMHQVRNLRLLYYHNLLNQEFVHLSNQDLQLEINLWRIKQRSRTAELRKRVDQKAIGASQTDILLDQWYLMVLKLGLADSIKAIQNRILQDDDLLEVQMWMEQSLQKFPLHLKGHRLIIMAQMARTMRHRYALFGTIPADAALDVYALFDEAYVEQRRERSILRGYTSLAARAQIFTEWTHNDHYLHAMALCVEGLGPPRLRDRALRIFGEVQSKNPGPAPAPQRSSDALMRELIEWAQKRKARSVVEVLGAEIIIPKSILATVRDDETALSLLEEEANLQIRLDSNPGDLVQIGKELGEVRKRMRECQNLKPIMDIRDGEAITSAEIQAGSQGFGPSVVIVDYVYIPDSSTGMLNDTLAMVYKNGILHSSNWIPPSLNNANLQKWADDAMGETEPLSTDDAEEYLENLAPLVTDAFKASEPGDTILLSPTGILFRIPLHAIPVNGQPLIERNPVVYTQSLSILRICGLSTMSLNADEPANPIAVQALPDDETALPSAPTMAFASKIGAPVLTGTNLTKKSFLEAITQSLLIHFYGHVVFDESKPLDHHMAIRGMEAERVTARDIFDTRLRSGAHVNLIGCQSGRSEVRANDDQFGLSTALLYAGAGSILSALWAIRKEDADAFQEAFFEELRTQCDQAPQAEDQLKDDGVKVSPVIDLAKALQKAVLKVSVDENGERRAPYHWAAFMLQGNWDALPVSCFHKK